MKGEDDWVQADSLKNRLFQDGCQMRQAASGTASTRTEAMSAISNAVRMAPAASILLCHRAKVSSSVWVTSTVASAPREQFRQGCVWAFYPSS